MNTGLNPAYLKREVTVSAMLGDMVLCLCSLLILPTVYYGGRALVLAAVSVLTACAAEVFCSLVAKRPMSASDFSPVVTGLVIALLLPVNVPLWLPAVAACFAVVVVRAPFGFTGHSPFNPAAAALAFVTICWPQEVFTYVAPVAGRPLPLFANVAFTAAPSPASFLQQGLKPAILPLNLLWGNTIGAMGTTALLVIGACALYLFSKKTSNWEITICYLAAAALIAAFFPRIATSSEVSIKYELLSGSLLFCSVFMVTDPVTSPRMTVSRCLYGAFAGALTMVFRHAGAYEQGAWFAVLLANACAPLFDRMVCILHGWGGKSFET